MPLRPEALARAGAVALAAALAACGGDRDARATRPVRVFAASSLTGPFEALAEAFAARAGGGPVELHFAGTPTLLMQLTEGARADVFAPADPRHMARAEAAGLVRGDARTLAHNALGIVVAEGNPRGVRGLSDLERADLRVALCGPEVPAGRYARAALDLAGVRVRSVSDERGADAALDLVTLPPAHAVEATYPIARVGDGAAGADFVAFASSPAGRAILEDHGFRVP